MAAHSMKPEHGPRITALPGPSTLVRITEDSWDWVRAVALDEEPPAELTEEQIVELELVGLLVDAPDQADALMLEPRWEQLLRAGLDSPVGIELVCVDGERGWTTRLRIAGRFVVAIDQEHEVLADAETMRLGRRSSALLLGVSTIEHLGATFEALVPQRPAFTAASAAAFTAADPAPVPAVLPDAPAIAEVQMLVVSAPIGEEPVVSGGSWYACGQLGDQLAVLVPGEDGAEARELAPGSLTSAMRAKVIAAIDHVTAAVGRAA